MIHIRETLPDGHFVTIWVDGILDDESIPILKNVCDRHLQRQRKILLQLGGLLHISRGGMAFLQEIQKKIILIDPPQFLKLTKNEKDPG
jgi:hypothetical protein